MDEERARVVLVAVVCVLAVAVAAATLASPTTPATTESGGDSFTSDGGGQSEGENGSSTADPVGSPGELSIDFTSCIPWLYSAPFWTAVAIVAIAIWFLVRYRMDSVAATAVVAVLALPFSFVWLLLSNCGQSPDEPTSLIPSDLDVTPAGENASYGVFGDGAIVGLPLWLIALVAVLGIGAVTVATMRETTEPSDPAESAGEEATERLPSEVATLREAAGDAADRIERNAYADNEIYRAWVAMTEHLDVDHPDASTPGEFETAAVEAGIDPETAAELTALFERVRYGHERPTAKREARAISALRAVEAAQDDLDEFWGEDG